MSTACSLACRPSDLVPKSTLLHSSESHHGLVSKPRHHGGKNIALLKNMFAHIGRNGIHYFLVERSGMVFLLFSVRNHIVMDGVTGGFYLGACTQGKANWLSIEDGVLN